MSEPTDKPPQKPMLGFQSALEKRPIPEPQRTRKSTASITRLRPGSNAMPGAPKLTDDGWRPRYVN